MKKFVLYNPNEEIETCSLTEDLITESNGFSEEEINEIDSLTVFETAVLSMEMTTTITRVWDV